MNDKVHGYVYAILTEVFAIVLTFNEWVDATSKIVGCVIALIVGFFTVRKLKSDIEVNNIKKNGKDTNN